MFISISFKYQSLKLFDSCGNASYCGSRSISIDSSECRKYTDYINILADKYEANDIPGYDYYLNLLFRIHPYAVITRIITGGRLQQTQYVDDSYYQSTQQEILSGCASAYTSFRNVLSNRQVFLGSYHRGNSDICWKGLSSNDYERIE